MCKIGGGRKEESNWLVTSAELCLSAGWLLWSCSLTTDITQCFYIFTQDSQHSSLLSTCRRLTNYRKSETFQLVNSYIMNNLQFLWVSAALWCTMYRRSNKYIINIITTFWRYEEIEYISMFMWICFISNARVLSCTNTVFDEEVYNQIFSWSKFSDSNQRLSKRKKCTTSFLDSSSYSLVLM